MTRLPALWQRNVIGAIVVAAALGILVAIDLGPQWATYRGTIIAEHVVPVGQSGTADGRMWKVESIRHLNRSPLNFGPPLPAGTVLTVVTLDRSGPSGRRHRRSSGGRTKVAWRSTDPHKCASQYAFLRTMCQRRWT